MRILVLGGTAFLSEEIVRQTAAAGHRIACLARGTAGAAPRGAEWIRVDRSLGAKAYDGVSGDGRRHRRRPEPGLRP